MAKITRDKQYARCVDCQTLRIVQRIEWTRAAVPRCYACGGRLDQCQAKSKSAKVDDVMRTAMEARRAFERDK